MLGNDGHEVAFHTRECVAGEVRFVAAHEVDVAAQRIDFAVMRDDAEGLREVPRGRGIGGETLVEHREITDETRVVEVGVKRGELLGFEQAFINDRARGKRTDIEVADGAGAHGVFDAAADEVEVALGARLVLLRLAGDDNLLDFGARFVGDVANHLGHDRHLPPAVDFIAKAQDFGFDNGAAKFLRGEIFLR